MMDEFQSLNAKNNENALEISKILIKAAKETHAVVMKAEEKSKRACESIATHNKETMWRTLQEYICSYANFINSVSSFTGVVFQRVDRDFYERVTAADVENQLQIMIGFVYAKEATDSAVKENYKQCVKKLLKQSKLFTGNELKHLPM